MRTSLKIQQWGNICSHLHTHSTETQILNSYLACPQHLAIACLLSLYNFTPINLTHLITAPPPRPQRSHILHTPLPPFWAQPQLWNHTANNSLACSLPLDIKVPPAMNYDALIIQNSMILPFLRHRKTHLRYPFLILACCLISFLSSWHTQKNTGSQHTHKKYTDTAIQELADHPANFGTKRSASWLNCKSTHRKSRSKVKEGKKDTVSGEINISEDRQTKRQSGQLDKQRQIVPSHRETDMAAAETMGPFTTTKCLCPMSVCITSVPMTAPSWRPTHTHRHLSDLRSWTWTCTHACFAFYHMSAYHVPCRHAVSTLCVCVCVWGWMNEWASVGLFLMTLFKDVVFNVRKHQSYVHQEHLWWWEQCETYFMPPPPQLPTKSQRLTGLYWSGLQVWSGVDMAQTNRWRGGLCIALLYFSLPITHSLLFPPKITTVFSIILFLFPLFPPSFSPHPPPRFFDTSA